MRDSHLKEKIKDFFESGKPVAQVSSVLLGIVFMAGVLTVAAMAPNVFQIFGNNSYNKKKIQRGLYYLKDKNFVEFIKEESSGKILVKITFKGKQKLVRYSIDKMKIEKPKKWDRKWRVVIFDVPNKYTNARNALRDKLKELGFFQFQKSAWIYPYPCFDEIIFIAKFYNVEKFVELFIVDEMLNDYKARKYFNL